MKRQALGNGAVTLTVTVFLLGTPFIAPASAVELNEALAQAYASNPTLEAARAELRAVDEAVPEALSGWRPTVVGEVEGGKRWIDQNTPLLLDQNLESHTFGVTVTQPVFSGFGTVSSTSAAENRVQSGRASLLDTEQQVMQESVRAYMQVVRDSAVVELTRKNEAVLVQQLQATMDRFEAGEVTRTDVAQAESRLQGAVARRVTAEGNLTAANAKYRKVIGDEPVDLKTPENVLDLPASQAEAVAQSVNAPTVVAAKYRTDAAKDDIDVAFSEMLPAISIEGSWQRGEQLTSKDQSADVGVIMGILSVPLYQAGAPDARVRQSKQVYQQNRRLIDEAVRAGEQQAVDAWSSYETAQAQILSFQEQVRATEVALDGVRQEQLVGARTVLDVLNAEQEALNAKVGLVQAETDLVVARYFVLASVGRLTASSLALDVRVYDPGEHYDAVRNKFIGTGPSVE